VPGTVARYRVTALDRAVPPNESAPTPAVELRIAAEPVSPTGAP
jgi:hypothetical protein